MIRHQITRLFSQSIRLARVAGSIGIVSLHPENPKTIGSMILRWTLDLHGLPRSWPLHRMWTVWCTPNQRTGEVAGMPVGPRYIQFLEHGSLLHLILTSSRLLLESPVLLDSKAKSPFGFRSCPADSATKRTPRSLLSDNNTCTTAAALASPNPSTNPFR